MQTNPRDHCKAVTTRSVRVIETVIGENLQIERVIVEARENQEEEREENEKEKEEEQRNKKLLVENETEKNVKK